MPRVLKYLVNSALPGCFAVLKTPPPLQGAFPRAPVVVNGLLRSDGLLDVFHHDRFLACPSVFSKKKWVKSHLMPYELLRTYDIPITMDALILPKCSSTQLPFGIEDAVSPLVITSILGSLWGVSGG